MRIETFCLKFFDKKTNTERLNKLAIMINSFNCFNIHSLHVELQRLDEKKCSERNRKKFEQNKKKNLSKTE